MSTSDPSTLQGKCALITGGAKRIGAAIASRLHDSGASIAIHYRGSEKDATNLCHKLNNVRQGSAKVFQADLNNINTLDSLVGAVGDWSGRIDALINNASSFYPTKIGSITEENWDELIGTNLRAPLFLSQAALPFLRSAKGCIVNIVDIHAMRPLRDHAVYGSAKAGLAMLTRSLAKDLAPDIRVNGVSPGAIMFVMATISLIAASRLGTTAYPATSCIPGSRGRETSDDFLVQPARAVNPRTMAQAVIVRMFASSFLFGFYLQQSGGQVNRHRLELKARDIVQSPP